MSQVICSSCFEIEDTTKRFIELPYVCSSCEKDSALAMDTYNSGVPCQSALDSVQANGYAIDDAHNANVLDQFDEDTELILRREPLVEVSLLGYGVSLYPTHVGGAPGVPRSYGWCIRLDWVSPWCYIDGEDMMMLPKKWWCNRCFYFGWGSEPRSLRRTVKDWLRDI